ncbi:MFS transporter [Microbacterium jiangjiandongii]|uniref:MFS transporter n=1 Tax=Microbacterium jiangjiandongii TaxID=3049071 RepID=UPI00214CD15C|nr:MFS transporter [Microbacterium sp. zg.Y843]MCR2814512.1 MFS transporter [Microbacterium sp. zg.Y843]
MKRALSLRSKAAWPLVAAGTALIAATYGLIRLAYGLFLVDVQRELGIEVAAAGAISGGASLMYCAAALIGFLTAERHAHALVIAAAAAAGIGGAGMALASDGAVFVAFAILSSAGAGFASPALVAVLQANRATRERPDAQSQVNAGTGPGLIVAGVLALALLPDWRTAWLISAGVTVAAAVAVVALDRDRRAGESSTRAVPPMSWFRAHARLIAAAVLMGAGSAAVWNYGRTLLIDGGADATVSVGAWIAIGAGGAAALVTARGLERMGPRAAWALTVAAVAVATGALVVTQSIVPLWLVACIAFGWGYTAGSGVLITWTARIDAPRAPAGTAMLFITLIFGQAVGAAVLGWVIAVAGYGPAFAAAAGLSAVAIATACWARTRRHQPQARGASRGAHGQP